MYWYQTSKQLGLKRETGKVFFPLFRVTVAGINLILYTSSFGRVKYNHYYLSITLWLCVSMNYEYCKYAKKCKRKQLQQETHKQTKQKYMFKPEGRICLFFSLCNLMVQ